MTSYVLGGGCFWCVDAVYRGLKGVTAVESGYAGGTDISPSYYHVASGKTGHAEVVRLTFDEEIIPSEIILDIFFLIHNPTTLNQQGADIGTQYRSVMLFTSNDQMDQFDAAINRAQQIWDEPIITEVSPLVNFFIAEDEHQDYFQKNPESGYCQIVVEPKVIKARQHYAEWFK
jgi:peptide-methionine (S)-S-oxide reductase